MENVYYLISEEHIATFIPLIVSDGWRLMYGSSGKMVTADRLMLFSSRRVWGHLQSESDGLIIVAIIYIRLNADLSS